MFRSVHGERSSLIVDNHNDGWREEVIEQMKEQGYGYYMTTEGDKLGSALYPDYGHVEDFIDDTTEDEDVEVEGGIENMESRMVFWDGS